MRYALTNVRGKTSLRAGHTLTGLKLDTALDLALDPENNW